jgi:(p)ppGpp synthase/HD superfamily hydrolase
VKTKENLLDRAAEFAWEAHNGQTRKYSGEPYFVHPNRVAHLVARETDDVEVIAAAYLHDVLEDTDTTAEELYAEFGARVTCFVIELTDQYTREVYPLLNRRERKKREADRMADISDEAKLIKRMDIADNTSDIVQNDPSFATVYLKEKAYLLERMGA